MRRAHGPSLTKHRRSPSCRARARGLSLIELLVAIAIIAALYGAIVLSVDAVGGARTVEREGSRLRALVGLACERAMLTGRDVGVHFGRERYAFSFSTPRGWRLDPGGSDLRPRELPEGLTLSIEREGADLPLEDSLPENPQVACFASGELTPFRAAIDAGPSIQPFELDAHVDGEIEGRMLEPAT